MLPEQAIGHHVIYDIDNDGTQKDESIPWNERTNESGYSGLTHEHVRFLIFGACEEQKQQTFTRLVHNRYKNLVFDLFGKAHEQARGNVYTSVFDVMEQAAVKALLAQGADELPEEKHYKLRQSHEFT